MNQGTKNISKIETPQVKGSTIQETTLDYINNGSFLKLHANFSRRMSKAVPRSSNYCGKKSEKRPKCELKKMCSDARNVRLWALHGSGELPTEKFVFAPKFFF